MLFQVAFEGYLCSNLRIVLNREPAMLAPRGPGFAGCVTIRRPRWRSHTYKEGFYMTLGCKMRDKDAQKENR